MVKISSPHCLFQPEFNSIPTLGYCSIFPGTSQKFLPHHHPNPSAVLPHPHSSSSLVSPSHTSIPQCSLSQPSLETTQPSLPQAVLLSTILVSLPEKRRECVGTKMELSTLQCEKASAPIAKTNSVSKHNIFCWWFFLQICT